MLLIGDGSDATLGLYRQWSLGERWVCVLSDPVGPSLTLSAEILRGFSTVVLLPANATPQLSDGFQRTLAEFVKDGGLLVCLPFTAWSTRFHNASILAELLPVKVKGFFEGAGPTIAPESYTVPALVYRNPATASAANQSHFRDRELPAVDAGSIPASIEDLSAKDGTSTRGSVRVDGLERPLAVSWRVGHGSVLYFNVCHHPQTTTECVWWPPGSDPQHTLARLLADYLDVAHWELATAPDRPRRSVPMLPRFVEIFATMIEGHQLAPPEEPRRTKYIANVWAHYGTEGDAESTLFPSVADFLALPRASRIMLCRALWVLADQLWHPSDRVETATPSSVRAGIERLLEPTQRNKGEMLEALAVYSMLSIEGLDVMGRNVRTSTGEVDAVLSADHRANARLWPDLPSIFAVECKNWEHNVSAAAIRDFRGKLDDLGLRLGVLFCRKGVSGAARRDALGLLRDYRRDGIQVLTVTADDLRSALRALDISAALKAARRELALL